MNISSNIKDLYDTEIPGNPPRPRTYHNIEHIMDGLESILPHANLFSPEEYTIVLNAWLYHDCIYYTSRKDSEFLSACYAANTMQEHGYNENVCRQVFDIICATKHSVVPTERLTQFVCDIDLLGLAAPFYEFENKAHLIKMEYNCSDEEFWKGRRQFWKNFLNNRKGIIYSSDTFKHLHEKAIQNINRQIQYIEGLLPDLRS